MGYFPQKALDYHRIHNPNTLEGIISNFPVRLKQVLYAVAEKGKIGSRRWIPNKRRPGCALYQAGAEEDAIVDSTERAASLFDVDEAYIKRFIMKWDSLRMADESRARILKEVLLRIGIATPVFDPEKPPVFDETVYKSAQSEFIETLKKVKTIEDMFPEEDLREAQDMLAGV